jgi:DNA-directed RNA polymerase specialized sigma24 family protein
MTRTPPPAFVSLLRVQQEPLLRAAKLLTGDWPAAEELLRRTLAWALANWATIERKEAPPTLLVRQELISLYLADAEDPFVNESVRDVATNPLHETNDAGTAEGLAPAPSLTEALAVLTPRDRVIAVSRYYLSLSAAEIGDVVDENPEDVDDMAVGVLAALQRSTVRAGGEG